ncbi:rhodanese-related sulfurtransferase [Pullulanibacillus sp. KACC 23026]|uniref:oxygen-dependent tRNA uridine(34) hydroxylase TrhO n=1 Tax=Pullulanibacillus sp. KACC 23026 TaxID=3028315 RepID=UPI0023B0A2FC|nr:rhodanese-related sulfurtransferase [Pullulanibacillus sp. KACC 23026]WEG10865.1 rhodanese-related sulfurtransferase [Pullulanibacillus sp. KACC 23026]
MSTKPYRVLLYYKYVKIEEPELYTQEHLKFCKDLGVKGRILISQEGINGTISGTVEQTDRYIEAMRKDPRFSDMVFKIDEADGHAFKRISVKHRNEIVTLNLDEDLSPNEVTGNYLSPKEWYEALQDEDVIVLDARNDYETQIGHFQNAIIPPVKAFRDLPKWIEENLADKKDKKILTYCTGGIRCEKFSGYLVKKGFKDVNQLHGGIVEYGKDPEVQGKLYEGKCYVFDERISVPINHVEDKVIGHCYYCGKEEDRLVNCANPECNRQHIACKDCEEKYERSCSKECREHPKNRYWIEKRQEEEASAQSVTP